MSTINLDVMKQLLQEFVEKDALASEEIKVVQQEIEELETRIKTCHDKLKVVSEDKQQINAMLQRYAHGAGSINLQSALSSSVSRSIPSGVAAESPAQPSPPAVQPVAATNLAQALSDSRPTQSQKHETTGKSASGKLLEGILAGATPANESAPANAPAAASEKPAEPPAPEDSGAKPDEAAEEPSDDAVKSINDALRGLFR